MSDAKWSITGTQLSEALDAARAAFNAKCIEFGAGPLPEGIAVGLSTADAPCDGRLPIEEVERLEVDGDGEDWRG